MAVVTPYSTLITGLEANPVQQQRPDVHRAAMIGSVAILSKAAGDSNNSLYRMLRVHSSFMLRSCSLLTDAWGASALVDIGFYDQPSVNAGAIVGTGQEFAASLDVSAAITTSRNLIATAGPTKMAMRVWERLGLSADPNKEYDIVWKAVNIGASQLANFSLDISYQR